MLRFGDVEEEEWRKNKELNNSGNENKQKSFKRLDFLQAQIL